MLVPELVRSKAGKRRLVGAPIQKRAQIAGFYEER